MQTAVITKEETNPRPAECIIQQLEELKKSFVKSIDIVRSLHALGLKFGLSNAQIRNML